MKTIVLAAGHGYRPDGTFDVGATNPNVPSLNEHSLNVKVRNAAIQYLSQYECKIISDENIYGSAHEPNWSGLIKYYSKSTNKPDLVLEIHHDSWNAANKGFGILPKTLFRRSITNLADDITKEYKLWNLPTKPSYSDVRGLGLLKVLQYPTLIWECAATLQVTDNTLNVRGISIAAGIAVWAGLNKNLAPSKNLQINEEYLRRVRIYFGLHGIGGYNQEFIDKLIEWKMHNGFFASPVIAPYHLTAMGIV